MQIEDNLRSGMTPAEARRDALIRSGGLERAKEAWRDRRGLPWLETLLRDCRYAARLLAKTPGFTALAAATLAVGIGANTALFSLIDAVLLEPLPYRDAARLGVPWAADPKRQAHEALVSYPDFLDWKRETRAFGDLAICTRDSPVTLAGAGEPERVDASRASPNLFALLGVALALGRAFTPEEEEGDAPVAVIGDRLWQRWFARAPDAIGRTFLMNGRVTTVMESTHR
jgi:hypothetical protein